MGFFDWLKKNDKHLPEQHKENNTLFRDELGTLAPFFRDLAFQIPEGSAIPYPTGCDLDGNPMDFVSFIVNCNDEQIAKVKEFPAIEVSAGIVTSIHEPTFYIIFIMFRFDGHDELTYSVPITRDNNAMNEDLLALSEQNGMQFILVGGSAHKVLRVQHEDFHKMLKQKLIWLDGKLSCPCPMLKFSDVVMTLNSVTQSAAGTWQLFEEHEGMFKINL
ncbi:hypothetical protein TUM4438_43520 [Shewanella sairae]|uniref:Uncharacterized protein n=1 Tax=Shewanella sairae TaxID=190310 RepID=A0ABQ4PSF1_9GAMM|nr:hypothetical protein TUM4438_43520 [Shewanella sairae]